MMALACVALVFGAYPGRRGARGGRIEPGRLNPRVAEVEAKAAPPEGAEPE